MFFKSKIDNDTKKIKDIESKSNEIICLSNELFMLEQINVGVYDGIHILNDLSSNIANKKDNLEYRNKIFNERIELREKIRLLDNKLRELGFFVMDDKNYYFEQKNNYIHSGYWISKYPDGAKISYDSLYELINKI